MIVCATEMAIMLALCNSHSEQGVPCNIDSRVKGFVSIAGPGLSFYLCLQQGTVTGMV